MRLDLMKYYEDKTNDSALHVDGMEDSTVAVEWVTHVYKVPEYKKKDSRLNILMQPEVKKQFEILAEKSGMSVSELVRTRVLEDNLDNKQIFLMLMRAYNGCLDQGEIFNLGTMARVLGVDYGEREILHHGQ